MLIGSKYADNKLYRGIKHYDKMPLTSDDVHEDSDTRYMKNAYIMNNLLGYGVMNTPNILETAEGLRLSEPSAVMIDGDISLIHSDEDKPLISKQSIEDAGYNKGIVGILGWYQPISVSSTLRNYGGVDNSVLENDLMDSRFSVAISSRYQFRWFPVIISEEDYLSDKVTITITDRDKDGKILTTQRTLESNSKRDNVFIFENPQDIAYIESDMYLVPIISYEYSSQGISNAQSVDKLRAGYPFISSETEPTGVIPDGATWYNPITREFKLYVGESGGFVSSASRMAFLQYQSVYVVDEATTAPDFIDIPIGINDYNQGDILRVIYEGLELVPDEHYTINYEDKTITLKEFTTNVGDMIYFTSTRVVEANDITNMTELFNRHIITTGNATQEGHVKLSDLPISDLDSTQGVAATPKLVDTIKVSLLQSIYGFGNTLTQKIEAINTDIFRLEKNISATTTGLSSHINEVDKELTKSVEELNQKIESSMKTTQDMIEDKTTFKDETTSTNYKLGIENGIIYLEEV